MSQDPLEYLPLYGPKWIDLQNMFRTDWPRGISGYSALQTRKIWEESGTDSGFKVFIPFGDVNNGMVAINEKNGFHEIIIQCPVETIDNLEVALRKTNKIDWTRAIIVPFAPYHVIECMKRVARDVGAHITLILPSEMFVLKRKILFEDVSLPPGITFDLLKQDHVDLIDTTWPHRYPTSRWYFEVLISTKSGYGLFLNNAPISWVFISEAGTFLHMYTIENHRQKGYAELLLKLVCNILMRDDREVFAFCVKGNLNACKLYSKVGFELSEGVSWCYLNGKS